MAHQDNDTTGSELSQSTSYAEMCAVEVFLLNRVSMISAVTSAGSQDLYIAESEPNDMFTK